MTTPTEIEPLRAELARVTAERDEWLTEREQLMATTEQAIERADTAERQTADYELRLRAVTEALGPAASLSSEPEADLVVGLAQQAAAMRAALSTLHDWANGTASKTDELWEHVCHDYRAALAAIDAGRGWVPREKAVELARAAMIEVHARWALRPVRDLEVRCQCVNCAGGKSIDALVAEVLGK